MTNLVGRRILLGVFGILPLVSLATVQPVSAATATSDISVTVVAGRAEVAMGHQISYVATLTNRGPDDASFVDLSFTLPSRLDSVSLTCDGGISPDGPTCEYSSLKAGQSVVTVLVATPRQGGHQANRKVRVTARAVFEVNCSLDPNCTFDPNSRNNSASVVTRLIARTPRPA